jgi:hypothetical protein
MRVLLIACLTTGRRDPWPTCALATLSLAIAFVVGCGGSADYPHATISGTVSVGGKPVEQGTISYFSDHSDAHRRGTGKIEQGTYQLTDVPLGATVFTFSASAETGRTVPGPGGTPEQERVNLIPPKYGREGIERDIQGDGTQDFDIVGST